MFLSFLDCIYKRSFRKAYNKSKSRLVRIYWKMVSETMLTIIDQSVSLVFFLM